MQKVTPILDKGREFELPGSMKFAVEGGTPNPLTMKGELKSSISSLNMIPLTLDRTSEPKLNKTSSQEGSSDAKSQTSGEPQIA